MIPNDSNEYKLVLDILKEVCKENYGQNFDFETFKNNNINDYSMWQLGVIGGSRIIGIRYINTFKVLFLDYHHLIYQDKNHNELNYDSFKFKPMEVKYE